MTPTIDTAKNTNAVPSTQLSKEQIPMLFPLIAVLLLLTWIGFVVIDMLGGKLSWPGQQARNLTIFFDSHRITSTLFIICFAIASRGHYLLYKGINLDKLAEDFYTNYFAEFLGIAATVFLIDRINRRRDQEREETAERDRLIVEMGSTNNDVALSAIKRIKLHTWLYDGALAGKNFSQANLNKAQLHDAKLVGTYFVEAILTNAYLFQADLRKARFMDADLREAKLVNADLREAKLNQAELVEAELMGADLREADLTGAYLMKADLTGADLRNANLTGASLIEAKLARAKLHDANLSNQRIGDFYFADFEGATCNKKTIWPDGLKPAELGVIVEEDLPTVDNRHNQE